MIDSKKLRKKFLDATLGSLRAADYAITAMAPHRMPVPDITTPIDIAIPVIPKDLPVLPLCVEGIRRNIPHPIREIYLIAPSNPDILKAAHTLRLKFIDETTILPGAPQDIPVSRPDRANRKGWIFQQFLKLSAKIGTADYTLFIDADHILLRPHTFLTPDERTILYTSKEFYLPYYDNIRRLTGSCPFARHSFISHKMLFHKPTLRQLQKSLSQHNNTDWKNAILNSIDWDYPSPFSEFELYGRFLPSSRKATHPWLQKALTTLPHPFSTLTHEQLDATHEQLDASPEQLDVTPADNSKSTSTHPSTADIYEALAKAYPRHLSVTLPAYLRSPHKSQPKTHQAP